MYKFAELRSPRIGGLGLDFSKYDNPGDYIIDVVGLDPERKGEAGAKGETELARHWAESAVRNIS